MDEAAWREQRERAIAHHAAAQQARRAAEAAQAREIVADFVREARERGIPAQPLRAHAYNGRTTYRTRLHGWYVHPNRLMAVSVDGQFYILTVPASLRARFTGATVAPAEPKLVVGEGGRDGDSIPLRTLLSMRLAQR